MNMQHTQILKFLTLLISSTFLCVPVLGEVHKASSQSMEGSAPALLFNTLEEAYEETSQAPTDQTNQTPVAIQETLEKAYMQNADLDAARAGLRAQDEDVSQAIADWRPSVSVTGTQTLSQTYPVSGRPLSPNRLNNRSHSNTTAYTAKIEQNVYQGGATVANIGQAESNVLAGKASLFNAEQTTFKTAIRAHTEIIKFEDIVTYRRKAVEFYKKNLDRAQARYEVGEGDRVDVEASRGNYEGQKAELSTAIGNLETAKAVYLHQIGNPAGKLAPATVIAELPKTVEEALEVAKIYSPLILQEKYKLEAAQYNVDVKIAGLLPVVDVNATAGNDRRGGTGNNHRHPSNTNLGFAATVTVPLYRQGIPSSQIRQAYQQVAQQKIVLVNAQRQTVENVQSAWDEMLAARQSVKGFLAQVKAQKLAVEAAYEEVNVGQKTVIDVLELEQDLIQAQIQLAEAQQSLIIASYDVLAAMGRLTARDMKLDVKYYDPDKYYNAYKDAWIQFWQGDDLRYVRDGDSY